MQQYGKREEIDSGFVLYRCKHEHGQCDVEQYCKNALPHTPQKQGEGGGGEVCRDQLIGGCLIRGKLSDQGGERAIVYCKGKGEVGTTIENIIPPIAPEEPRIAA